MVSTYHVKKVSSDFGVFKEKTRRIIKKQREKTRCPAPPHYDIQLTYHDAFVTFYPMVAILSDKL